jgi:hypothetical protein
MANGRQLRATRPYRQNRAVRVRHPRSKRGEDEPMNVSGVKEGGQTDEADSTKDLATDSRRLQLGYSLKLLRSLVCLLYESRGFVAQVEVTPGQ